MLQADGNFSNAKEISPQQRKYLFLSYNRLQLPVSGTNLSGE